MGSQGYVDNSSGTLIWVHAECKLFQKGLRVLGYPNHDDVNIVSSPNTNNKNIQLLLWGGSNPMV